MPNLNQSLGTQTFDHAANHEHATRTIAPQTDLPFAATVGFATNVGSGPSAIASGKLIGGRYQLLNEIARGGMGVVYAARDTTLNRDVAIKLLLDRYSATSNTASRFVEEAQIAGQLQHPGIAPVHDLGTFDNGRPFLAMKLIKGQTLAALLVKKKPELPQLIEYFAGIVRALAYAHNKGVIHRDLKPGNIMVGAFGEVQVMDWGLAKTLGTPTGARIAKIDTASFVSVIETDRTPDSATQAGSILGTPAYMPPEQAKGLVEQTDTRSDVFALGAILCELLTGKPPYTGNTFDEIRAQSIMGFTQPAIERIATSGADDDLIALATRCLDPNPMNRPSDAGVVGQAVAAYHANVSDRLKRAEQDKAAADIRIAEQLKRRRVLLTCGGVLGVAAIAFGLYQNTQNRKLETQTKVAIEAQSDAVKSQADSDRNAALAQMRLEKAVEAVETVMTRVAGEKWALKPELQEERREVLVEAVAFFNGLGSEDSRDPIVRRQAARANMFASTAMISLAEYDQGEAAANVAVKLYRSLQQDLPNDSSLVRGEAEAVALVGHTQAIRARFNDALRNYETCLVLAEKAAALEPERDENQLAIADSCSSLALFYSFQRPELSRQFHSRALAIGETLCQKPAPGFKARLILVTSLVNLAIAELNGPNRAKAQAMIDRAAEQIRVMDLMTPPTSRSAETFLMTKAGLGIYRGFYLIRGKKIDDGFVSMKSGIDMVERLLAIQPKSFPFQIQSIQFQVIYADALLSNGRTDDGAKVLDEFAWRQKKLIEAQPQLDWVKSLGQIQRSLLLVHRVRESFSSDFEIEADRLLDAFGETTPALKYNIACAYAQAALACPEKDRVRYADRAMLLLNELLTKTDYFALSVNSYHLDKDSDFDPIRERADYREFAKKVKARANSEPMQKPTSPGKE